MHVLSRKKNEAIVIGDNIIVTVVEIRGDKVRLGIEIPKEMSLHRTEVWEALQRHAATTDASPPPAPAAVHQPEPTPPPPKAPDKLDQVAARLQSMLGVRVTRDQVAEALKVAGIPIESPR